jgi:hypothetical protein
MELLSQHKPDRGRADDEAGSTEHHFNSPFRYALSCLSFRVLNKKKRTMVCHAPVGRQALVRLVLSAYFAKDAFRLRAMRELLMAPAVILAWGILTKNKECRQLVLSGANDDDQGSSMPTRLKNKLES